MDLNFDQIAVPFQTGCSSSVPNVCGISCSFVVSVFNEHESKLGCRFLTVPEPRERAKLLQTVELHK
jgi:hypothetical protein